VLTLVAGFRLGVLRTLVVVPLTGDLVAVALELSIMLIISWLICGLTLRRLQVVDHLSNRIAMGD
jgi:hypothetical protein